MKEPTIIPFDADPIPMSDWERDHWSTLGYLETVIVNLGYFEICLDGRMRQKRYHFRHLSEHNPRPRRIDHCIGIAMNMESGSRLSGNRVMLQHDDWDCVADMIAAGFFNEAEFEAGVKLTLSDYGADICAVETAQTKQRIVCNI